MGKGVVRVKVSTMLKLGRMSNLPTIWTNTAVGLAFAGLLTNYTLAIIAMVAMSLMYIGGMFLNDAFDAKWDAQHNATRPIPSKETTVEEAAAFGSLFFLAAILLIVTIAREEQIISALISAVGLIVCILIYDWKHKAWSFSAWIMGACRLLVYVTAADLLSNSGWPVLAIGACVMAYIAGITYLARSEHLNQMNSMWPIALLYCPTATVIYFASITNNFSIILLATLLATIFWTLYSIRSLMPGETRNIGKAISNLLAGICLLDASFLFLLDQVILGRFALVAFILCLLLQRKIPAS